MMTSTNNNYERLINIVSTILDPPDSTSAEMLSTLEDEFCNSITHPGGAALLHYPEDWGLSESPSALQIVGEALNWKPQIVVMKAEARRPHFKSPGLFVYDVTTDRIRTQIVSKVDLIPGQLCEVALSGAQLPDGRKATHGFVSNVFTAGEIVKRIDVANG